MSAQLLSRRSPAVPLRGVHLDLKGNPPTPRRLLGLLDLFAALRLNVVLAEWEDTFPWRYPELRSPTAYPPGLVRRFFARARELGIEVIPLVQCLGHAENVLSRKRFQALREIRDNVAEFCPSNPKSARLVIEMVDDVLDLAGGRIRWFHLGGDEAWHMGSCPRCRRVVSTRGKGELYLRHVGPILDHLGRFGLKPILWDDMMRHWPAASLRQLADRADLMAWSYSADPVRPKSHFTEDHLRSFRRAGITVWAGSAYKGGDGADRDVPDLAARCRNNLAWIRLCRRHSLTGMVATAWSRYNTMHIQCETIESSLDALVLAAAIMWDGADPRDGRDAARRLLRRIRRGTELKVFDRCFAAASALARWREGAIAWWLGEAETAVHRNGEPEKLNPYVARTNRERIAAELKKGRKLGHDFVRAHRGLIPDRWLTRYVASRIDPLARRARNLALLP